MTSRITTHDVVTGLVRREEITITEVPRESITKVVRRVAITKIVREVVDGNSN